jgi:predicted dehydrogenase
MEPIVESLDARVPAALRARKPMTCRRCLDAHVEVYGDTSSFRVQYNTPYVRHFPTLLVREDTTGNAFERTVSQPGVQDPYTHELEYFHEMVTQGGTPKTTPEDFVEDLELFAEIIRVLGKDAS